MGRFVIVAYKPRPGMDQQLLAAVTKHLEVLKSEHLVTDNRLMPCVRPTTRLSKYLSGALPRPSIRFMAIQSFKRFGLISVLPVITLRWQIWRSLSKCLLSLNRWCCEFMPPAVMACLPAGRLPWITMARHRTSR